MSEPTKTLAEILTHHLDAAEEGRVRHGDLRLEIKAGRWILRGNDSLRVGLALDGYTIVPKEPEKVMVPRHPWLSSRGAAEAYAALLDLHDAVTEHERTGGGWHKVIAAHARIETVE